MILHAVLGNPNHPEYGVATIPFPSHYDQYGIDCTRKFICRLRLNEVSWQ